jgi:arylsulfatase A-like enzyme
MKPMRAIHLALLLSPVVMLHALESDQVARKPNIVFILADDLGYMDLGCYNPRTFYETPCIDALAARGMRFTAGYATCPVCSPSRASIMTGKYPTRTGITDWIGGHGPRQHQGRLIPAQCQDHLALEEVTIAEALRDAGYETFMAGKWHLGEGGFGPGAQGFDPHLQGSHFFFPPGVPALDRKDDPKNSELIADLAVRFITAHKDGPFFVYLPFPAVHIPVKARADLVTKYKNKATTLPENTWGREGNSKVRQIQSHPGYAAMIEQLDTSVGRVVDAIVDNGLRERTIIIFTSDNGGLATNGYSTSNLPLRGGKGWPYEGGIREPWIVVAPGLTTPGSICDVPVISTDFYATMLDCAGLPAMPAQHRDSTSFRSLLGGGQMTRGSLYWHYPHYGNQGGAPFGAMRDGDWKIIEWYEDGRRELYNLRDDLGELHDLAAKEPDRVAIMWDKLEAWRRETKAFMPVTSK